jgi:hypothetical protein
MEKFMDGASSCQSPPQGEGQVEAFQVLAKHWPSSGSGLRHKAHGALIGGLLRDGLSVPNVVAIVEALCEATADEEVQKRLARVVAAHEGLKASKSVTGWPTLAGVLGPDGWQVVGRARALLGLTITVEALAEHKRLPVEFLHEQGLRDLPEGGVGIPYRTPDGQEVVKRRVKLRAGDGSYWPQGQPLLAYGETRLDEAVKVGYLVLVEGESDSWTLWYHGIPALGLPGADTVAKTLHLGHISNIPIIYVVEEHDEAGKDFVANVSTRLAALGWCGQLKVVRFPDAKDVSELHCQDPEAFGAAWQEAVRQARPAEMTAAALISAAAASPWPEPLAVEALHGLAGDVVRAIESASEADPAALLIQFLVGFGSLIGRKPHFVAEADGHYTNEFVVLVGRTAKGRKGSSWGQIRQLLGEIDWAWDRDRIASGLSSGEGLIHEVRDQSTDDGKVIDPGMTDKRLLVVEAEFASVLRQIERQGNTLSAVLRTAWESGSLRSLVKHSPTRATGAHISLIGHCTAEELRRYLSTTEIANGFGNRFLWFCVKRSKLLPDGGCPDPLVLAGLRQRLNATLAFARGVDVVGRNPEARAIWHAVYGELSEGTPGLSGALTGRAEAHVMRLAVLYALLDRSAEVRAEHLNAALALWDYVDASVRHVFGDRLGDPVADDLLRILRAAADGLTRTQISNHFGRHQSTDRISQALALLAEHYRVHRRQSATGGRPEERWYAGAPPT